MPADFVAQPRFSRRAFLCGAAVGALACGAAVPARASRRPNVVLVMTDDQGYGDLGCLGNPVLKTPHLDRLHAESARLTDFHVSPTCAPTRAALLTGRYNNRSGVWHTVMGRSLLARDEKTMADYFAGAGYRTGLFGKWHLGDDYPYRPRDRGFQEVLAHGGGGIGQTPDYWGNEYINDTYFHNGEPESFEAYCTDVWFDAARRFITEHRDAPFFCYLPTNAPHHPYIVPPEYSEPFKAQGLSDDQANFYGMIANLDENMGRLLQTLDEQGIAEDTILIFMTDNGTSAGDRAGMRGAKGSEYEGGHRVPCFVRWPAGPVARGADIPVLSAHIDLLPTLLGYCGISPEGGPPFDGVSLAPWLNAPETPAPERAIVVDSQRIEHPEKWRKSAVLEGRWRLINGTELYDLSRDPGQEQDRAAEEPALAAHLREVYERWWADVSRTFDRYCPLVIGAAGQGATHLNGHDWHTPIEQIPWHQKHILAGLAGNGFWAVEVAEAGEYHFALRRWPREANAPIRAAVDGGAALAIVEARIRIGGQEASSPVNEGDVAADFTLRLEKGETRLETAFIDEAGVERGAYYVSVTRTG
ncbi:MAG: arylsulfatase [Candidatus Hydrogenedentes bacterium]|nr:arylsulfatase [Candidatus Hydrogenedentota bacterium]